MKEGKVMVTAVISDEQKRKIDEIRSKTGTSLTFLILRAVNEEHDRLFKGEGA